MKGITLYVDDKQFARAKEFSSVFGYLMLNIAVMLAPFDTGNLRRSIALTQNNSKKKQITYSTMTANYIRFLEEGIGPVKVHKGFISVNTTYAIVEGISNIILTGNYPYYSFTPQVELKDTDRLFSKEKQILKAHDIKTERISADVRMRISMLREREYRQKNKVKSFSVSTQTALVTKKFAYGTNKGNSVLRKAYSQMKKGGM